MSATCVLQYAPCGLSKHGDPAFPDFCPLNQDLAHVTTRGLGREGGYHIIGPINGIVNCEWHEFLGDFWWQDVQPLAEKSANVG